MKNLLSDDVVRQVTSMQHPKKKGAVDCTNRSARLLLVYEGIQLPRLKPVDTSIYQKSEQDRRKLKLLKAKVKADNSFQDEFIVEAIPPDEKCDRNVIIHIDSDGDNKCYNTFRLKRVCLSDVSSFILNLTTAKKKVIKAYNC